MKLSKPAILYTVGTVVAVVATLAGPSIVARLASPTTSLNHLSGTSKLVVPDPESLPFLLVVGARPERMAEEDPRPHRNSQVGLYQRDPKGSGWELVEGPLPIRASSTSRNPRPKGGASDSQYGYLSVPMGLFTLRQDVWRDRVTPAFLISDWGSFGGTIGLRRVQELRRINGEGKEVVMESANSKSGSWIHPTLTVNWSGGDSNGCMNLFRPEKRVPGESYPYDEFLAWLSSRDITPGPSDWLPLVVLPHDRISDDKQDLAARLPMSIFSQARALQGEQLEDVKP
jgi:hypothetical protein